MERDSGNMFVLEAIIIAMILLGAAYAVSTLRGSSLENVRPRAELERVASDALTVLAGLHDGNKTPLLDVYLLEALHCAKDVIPSPLDCQERRSRNLSIKLDNYLPVGGGYGIAIGNGAASREIYRSPLPQGEAVAASRGFAPSWNTSFVFTDFSCYPVGADAKATLIPIDRSRIAKTDWGNVRVADVDHTAQRLPTELWWNVTLPGATRPAAADVRANATAGSTTFPGLTAYGECAHGELTSNLRTALAATTVAASSSTVPVASRVAFTADLAGLAQVAQLAIQSATVTVYEPVPSRMNAADTWIRAGDVVTLSPSGTSWSGTWTAPADAFYGAHPALLRVTVSVGGSTFELRRATVVDVALVSGEVPLDPPYRAVVQAWLADWG